MSGGHVLTIGVVGNAPATKRPAESRHMGEPSAADLLEASDKELKVD